MAGCRRGPIWDVADIVQMADGDDPAEAEPVPWVQCDACNIWRLLLESWPEGAPMLCHQVGATCRERDDDDGEWRPGDPE